MLAELAVIVVILATVIFVYLKSTLIKSFVILINIFIASTVAMAFFETLARLVIGYGFGGDRADAQPFRAFVDLHQAVPWAVQRASPSI